MRIVLTIMLIFSTANSFADGKLIKDKTLKKIILSELNQSNPDSILAAEDIEISFSERGLNPYYAGYYSRGEIRELRIDNGSIGLNCTMFMEQEIKYSNSQLSADFKVNFEHCESNGNVIIPTEPIVFNLK